MGRLQFAMAPDRIERIEIEAYDKAIEESVLAVATGTLAGLLSGFLPDSANLVNAPALVAEHGIAVAEAHGIGGRDYPNMISCRVAWQGGERTISGVVFENREGRIVQVIHYRLDADPRGVTLVMLSKDMPGVIGEVGTLLGVHKVNIAEWRLGRDQEGRQALSFINLDSPPDTHMIDELVAMTAVVKAMIVEL